MAGTGAANSAHKQIPLLCTVCPDAPRFSDVSHLLTHIASKGHLHHETQTKLKAHQDIAASVALRQYEVWYSQNGIETLLVERMKAKQVKEAARTRRNRVLASVPPAKVSVCHPRGPQDKADTWASRSRDNPSEASVVTQPSKLKRKTRDPIFQSTLTR